MRDEDIEQIDGDRTALERARRRKLAFEAVLTYGEHEAGLNGAGQTKVS